MLKMIKKLPVILIILVVLYVLYSSQIGVSLVNAVENATGLDVPLLGDHSQAQAQAQNAGPKLDLGMYDIPNPNAFGTTSEEERRMTNDGVRKEYHTNPFPWAECTCSSGNCDKHGVPKPAVGQTHVCRNGFPSKRVVDSLGGHFQLNHICAPSVENSCNDGPAVLGRWWSGNKCGCSNPESVGLDVRPACTRCG